jgi:pyruvate dehydrogenase E1 component beta subunit
MVSEICFGGLKLPVRRLGFAPAPCPSSRPLENCFYPDAVTIIRAAEKMLGLKAVDITGEEFYSYEKKFKGPF